MSFGKFLGGYYSEAQISQAQLVVENKEAQGVDGIARRRSVML